MDKFTVEKLNLHYGEFHALKDINLNLPANEITAFIGPSGCGKSTFLKTLNRMNDLVDLLQHQAGGRGRPARRAEEAAVTKGGAYAYQR